MSAELVTWGGDAMPDGVTISPPAPVMLSARAARKLTDRIRRSLEQAASDLLAAYRGRAHEALGYGDGASGWQGYVEAEFGDLRLLRLPVDDRLALTEAMTADGFSVREQARGTGVSVGQAHADRARLRAVPDLPEADGQPAPEPPPAMSKRDRAVQLVAEQAGRGLTALELAEVTGWTGGSATGTMCDVHRQGRVQRTEVYRRGYAAYTVTAGD